MTDRKDTKAWLPTRPSLALDRRGFLKAGAVAGALALVGGIPARAQGKPGGHLRIGIADGASTDTLDSAALP